jgi:hypothetical protein
VQDSNTQIAASTISFTALPPPAVSTTADSRTVAHTITASFTPLANDSVPEGGKLVLWIQGALAPKVRKG